MAKNNQSYGKSINKLNDNEYSAQNKNLDFGFERVTSENVEFWKGYAEHQKSLCGGTALSEVQSIQGTADTFKMALNYYNTDDVWVAYAATKDTKQQNSPLKQKGDIQICTTIGTTKDLPFTTHLGIFKAYEFSIVEILKKLPKEETAIDPETQESIEQEINKYKELVTYKGLSLDLHSFAAKAAQTIYGNKEYMITKPVTVMLNILTKNLPEEAIFVNHKKYQPTASSPFKLEGSMMMVQKKSGEQIFLEKPAFWSHMHLRHGFNPAVIIDIDVLASLKALDGYDPSASTNSHLEIDNSQINIMAEKDFGINLDKHEINPSIDKVTINLTGDLEYTE
jgi:hypothetical protein